MFSWSREVCGDDRGYQQEPGRRRVGIAVDELANVVRVDEQGGRGEACSDESCS